MIIQSVWKNLTGLQKDKSWSQLNTSGVTLNTDPEAKIHHHELIYCIYLFIELYFINLLFNCIHFLFYLFYLK